MGILEPTLVLRTEEDLLTSLLGGAGVGEKEGNIGVVDPAFEKASEALDCETATECGLFPEVILPSFDENVERRLYQLLRVVLEGSCDSSTSCADQAESMLNGVPDLLPNVRFNDRFGIPNSCST